MSEYQYYEFLAVDRPLTRAEQDGLRGLSSRARITANSFTNEYEWGDFRGDPVALMSAFFDLHVYHANWGTHRLMIRLPVRLIGRDTIESLVLDDEWAKVHDAGDNLILDIELNEIDLDYVDNGTSWLAMLAPLRADLLAGDRRVLYLIWLMAVEYQFARPESPEPLDGIGPMTDALDAFARFFQIDPNLVAAAAERGNAPATLDAATVVAALTEAEKTALLIRVFDGDPLVSPELRGKARHARTGNAAVVPRTVEALRKRAQAIGEEKAGEERAKEVAARRTRVDAILKRGDAVWREVEAEIELRNNSGYDRATALLRHLREVAEDRDTLADFASRLAAIRSRHARKGQFIVRIAKIV